jgi:hypothetical protein
MPAPNKSIDKHWINDWIRIKRYHAFVHRCLPLNRPEKLGTGSDIDESPPPSSAEPPLLTGHIAQTISNHNDHLNCDAIRKCERKQNNAQQIIRESDGMSAVTLRNLVMILYSVQCSVHQ